MSRTPRLVVVEPDGSRREAPIAPLPYRIGRQAGNELTLRDSRISRQQAQIIQENAKYVLEDMGSRHGTFVNGQKVLRHELKPQDKVDFGVPDSYLLIFGGEEESLGDLLHRVETTTPAPGSSRGLYHLGVLLEVARALHSSMSLEDVLTSVVDAAIQVTRTERGVLLLRTETGEFEPSVARDVRQNTLRPEDLDISKGVLRQVTQSRRELVFSDTEDDIRIKQQESVVRLALHTVVAIPLEKLPVMGSLDTTVSAPQAELLGVLYLDSHLPSSAFTELDRQVVRSLAMEAATVVENARLFALSRQRERLEHEMKIAQGIQRQLLPKKFPEAPNFVVTGMNIPCETVGGDFFDMVELAGGRYGFVVADVSGKGIPAALLASMLQGVFSATAGSDLPQHMIATRVNKYLSERSADDRYATLFYGVLDPAGNFEYINAGHVPAMVRSSLGQVYSLASDNFPLGMFDFAEYHSARSKLLPGDFLVIYSDGISEARNPREDLYGEHRLRDLLIKFPGKTAEELLEAIQIGVREFTAGAPQADDMTVVVVHCRDRGK